MNENATMTRGRSRRLLQMFTSPTQAFTAMATDPDWVPPLVATLAAVFVLNAAVIAAIGAGNFTRAAMGDDPRAAELAQRAERNAVSRGILYAGPPLMAAAGVLAVAGFFWLASAILDFKVSRQKVLAVVAHSYFVYFVATGALVALVAWTRSDLGDFDVEDPIISSLADLLDKESTNPFLFKMASSLDLFSALCVFLLATGLAIVCPVTRCAAWALVLGTWLVYILARSVLVSLIWG